MNSTIICGRLTKDPEVRQTEKTKVARFTVAVGRPYSKNGDRQTDFFPVLAFGKNAEFCEKYLKKGSRVIVRGHMEQDKYTNKDGNEVRDWKLMLDEIDFGESKKDDSAKPEEKADAPAEEGYMELPDGVDDVFPFA